MDSKMQKIIAAMEAKRKPQPKWNRGETVPQPWHQYDLAEGQWQTVKQAVSQKASGPHHGRLTIISWNIDFMRLFPSERMAEALTYLRKYIEPLDLAPVIMLNEMTEADLEIIQAEDWIRAGFVVTDLTNEYWESGYYGTCVLLPAELSIKQVWRVHYNETRMERDALFIDTNIGTKSLRLCCTHLESLIADPPRRPSQLAQAASYMHEADASILGGDLNAIQPFDRTLHIVSGLRDAYLERGGVEDDIEGMTWGQMASTAERNKFGLTRMDKFMCCGALSVLSFETFGLDAVISDEEVASKLVSEDGLDQPWVTDHLGIKVEIEVVEARPTSSL